MFGTVDELLHDDVPDRAAASAVSFRKKLFYFCSEVSDATTLKRIQQFIDHGFDITVFGFRRTRYNTGYEPTWPYVPLGLTVDGRYWHRLRAMIGALPAILANRRRVKGAAVFYARNLDQLVLALFARLVALSRAPIVYEVLDIPPFLAGRSPGSMLLRWIERLCLHGVKLLVLSSPAFHRQYYAATQKYRGPWFLLENKLHPSIAAVDRPAADAPARERGRPWVVGYFGLIRGQGTFDLMTRLAERLKGRVVFRFRGALTTVDAATFHTAIARLPNMEFGGPYLPHQDLAALYRDVDFAWALDLEHTDHNSRWLMPCRFYESGYFGVPCLAVRSFEVGSVLERHRIGFTFERPLEDQLVHFFETLTVGDYEHIRARLRAVPREMFVASDDATRLCTLMEGLPRSPRD
jgi:succinoglycan biosynthesis protein ExoL